jgi:hypothetical protein
MRSIKLAACIAALTAGVGFAATAANAASVTNCLDMADKVNSALANNMQAAGYDDAKRQRNFGRDYCASSQYDQGVAHYSRALQLLGEGEKADRGTSTPPV